MQKEEVSKRTDLKSILINSENEKLEIAHEKNGMELENHAILRARFNVSLTNAKENRKENSG
jgi:hypothetical protein